MSFKGMINVYSCDRCREHMVTKDIDDGTTPFMTKCRMTDGCDGYAQSGLYRTDQLQPHDFEWYRPDLPERSTLSPSSLHHVNLGGLLLRAKG